MNASFRATKIVFSRRNSQKAEALVTKVRALVANVGENVEKVRENVEKVREKVEKVGEKVEKVGENMKNAAGSDRLRVTKIGPGEAACSYGGDQLRTAGGTSSRSAAKVCLHEADLSHDEEKSQSDVETIHSNRATIQSSVGAQTSEVTKIGLARPIFASRKKDLHPHGWTLPAAPCHLRANAAIFAFASSDWKHSI